MIHIFTLADYLAIVANELDGITIVSEPISDDSIFLRSFVK